jgi:cysteine-rich repeat protein
MTRTVFSALVLSLAACPIQQAVDDFYEHHVTRGSTGSESTAFEASESTAPDASESSSTASSDASSTTGETTTVPDASSTVAPDASSTTAPDTTGEPAPVCGNGRVEPGEECDDADDDDADDCNHVCARPRLVFLTSETFYGELHGLAGADTRCAHAAAKAGLPDPFNFKAILSDSSVSARDRLFHARGPYRLVNGLQVVPNFDALWSGALDHPIDTTELGTFGYPGAWTGTRADGSAYPGVDYCLDWESMSGFDDFSSYGHTSAVDAEWIEVANPVLNPSSCVGQYALYCLEQQ